jgi:hypothetical protein
MEKPELIRIITEQYKALGVVCIQGGTADITVDQEVLGAKLTDEMIKIRYQNSVLISEDDQTVYFWEQAKNIKSGFSFGRRAESRSKPDTALRKVKSVQSGIEGRTYEIEFDIGRLSKIVKTNAIRYGFKLKTVSSKKMASY